MDGSTFLAGTYVTERNSAPMRVKLTVSAMA